MSLYDRSVDLQLKIEAAQTADAIVDLLARATHLVADLDNASTRLKAAARFGTSIGALDGPPVDVKAVSQAVGAFRGGLSRHGANALQHQPASALADTARNQQRKVTQWVNRRWKELFLEYDTLVDRVTSSQLVGNSRHRVIAQARASTLRTIRELDPISDAAKLETKLGGGRSVEAWLDSVREIAAELRTALQALDAERAALTPQVQRALSAAASGAGLSLSDVTADLLAALKAAGVDGNLVVRRL